MKTNAKKLKQLISCLLVAVMLVCGLPMGEVGTKASAATNIPSDAVEFNGHYYKVYDKGMTWTQAKVYCESLGGHLVTITSQEENDIITKFVVTNNTGIMIGFTDEKEEGKWRWVTDEKVTYTSWRRGEPNNEFNEDYALADSLGTWNDGHLERENGWMFVCEWESGEFTAKGTLDSYVVSVVLDDGKNWVSEVTINGKEYKVQASKLTNQRAEYMQGKEVIATVKNGEIVDIDLLDDVLNTVVTSKDTQKNYGTQQSCNTLLGDIQQNVISLYQNLNSVFVKYKDKTKSGVHASANDIQLLADDLKRSGKIATAGLSFYSQEEQDGFYLAFAECMLNDMGLSAIDLGKISFSSTTKAATQITNQIMKSFKSVKKSYTVNGKRYTFDIFIAGDAFTGNCIINSNNLVNPQIMINSSVKKTFQSLTYYIDHLSDKVNEGLYQAFWSPIKDIADVTGLSGYTESQINSFLSKANQKALKKAGFGDVIKVFINLKKCYNTISAIKTASTSSDLMNALKNGQAVYNTLNGLSFSKLNYGDVMTKAEKEMLEELKERAKKSIYNYLYGQPEKSWFESSWEKFTQKIGFHCPVDFEVYDKDNNLIGWVDTVGSHEESIWYTDDIMIGTYDDAKYLFLPENFEVTLKMTATDDGTMDCIIEQKDTDKLSRLNYYDVKLETGKTFDINISTSDKLENIKDTLTINDEKVSSYYQDTDVAFSKIDVDVIGNGVITGKGQYPYGDLVQLNAIERDDATVFVGWYENDELISNNPHIQFTSREDCNLVAKFADKYIINSNFYAIEEDDYEDIYAELYSVNDAESKIILSFVGEELDLSELNVKCLDENNNVVYIDTVQLEERNDELVSTAFRTLDAEKIEVKDKYGILVVTFVMKYSSLIAPSYVLVSEKEKELTIGESFDLLFNVVPLYSNNDVSVVSSNENVITISEDGTVTAIGGGKAFITITSKSNSEIKSTCVVTVVDNVSPTTCSHICHKTGIMGFFYKIARLFWKLFKINKTCACGVDHY